MQERLRMLTPPRLFPGVFASVSAIACVFAFVGCGSDEPKQSNPPTETPAGAPTAAVPPTTDATTGVVIPSRRAELEDGRHFGFIRSIDLNAGNSMVVFDLAYFLGGDEANAAAAERGDETPVANDYYIVNDNPRLRTLAVSSNVEIVLVDWRRCCEKTFSADHDRFQDSFRHARSAGNYRGRYSHYWLTSHDGVVIKIEEQYVP